jgi:hypothetical protein
MTHWTNKNENDRFYLQLSNFMEAIRNKTLVLTTVSPDE